MSLTTYSDENQLITTYYDPAAPAPKRFFVWFEMRRAVIVAEADEDPAATWRLVLSKVCNMRKHFLEGEQRDPDWKKQAYVRGSPWQHAHIFAGVDMPEELEKQLTKRWIIWWCFRMASPSRNPDHEARIEALALICRLEGWYAPQQELIHIAVR